MSDNEYDIENFSIPGIFNSKIPENFLSSKTSKPDGSIEIKIFGPVKVGKNFPNFKIFVSKENAREKEVLLKDEIGCLIFSKLQVDNFEYEDYYLQIKSEDAVKVFDRGCYVIRVLIDDEEVNLLTLNIKTHPASAENLEYDWSGN